MIGTLAVDGWAVTFGTARTGLGGSTSYYSMWHSNGLRRYFTRAWRQQLQRPLDVVNVLTYKHSFIGLVSLPQKLNY